VPGRALLEPQPVVLGRILKELRRLLENVLLLRRCAIGTTSLRHAAFGSDRVVDPILDRFLAPRCSFWRFCLRRWRVLGRDAFSPGSPPAEKSVLTLVLGRGGWLGGFALRRRWGWLAPRGSRAWPLKAVLERLTPVTRLGLVGVLVFVVLLVVRFA